MAGWEVRAEGDDARNLVPVGSLTAHGALVLVGMTDASQVDESMIRGAIRGILDACIGTQASRRAGGLPRLLRDEILLAAEHGFGASHLSPRCEVIVASAQRVEEVQADPENPPSLPTYIPASGGMPSPESDDDGVWQFAVVVRRQFEPKFTEVRDGTYGLPRVAIGTHGLAALGAIGAVEVIEGSMPTPVGVQSMAEVAAAVAAAIELGAADNEATVQAVAFPW